VVLGGVAVAAVLFGVVAFHVVLTQGQLDLQHLRARADAASVRQQQLRLQAAQLESPARVVQDAQHLGMVPPATVRYLTPASATAPATAPAPAVAATPAKALATTVPARPVTARAPVTTVPPAPAKAAAPPKAAAPKAAPATTAPARPTR
jgi:hypothetical protein